LAYSSATAAASITRLWTGDKAIRRSTGALTKSGAESEIPTLKTQLQREAALPPLAQLTTQATLI
jgi:hypothetical protein